MKCSVMEEEGKHTWVLKCRLGERVEESNKDEMTQFGLYNFMRLSVGVRMVGNYNR